MRRLLPTLSWIAGFVLIAGSAQAKGKGLRALSAPEEVIFDGEPKEFDTDWRKLDQTVRGETSASDLEAKATVAYDAKGWYVAADVTDDTLVGGGDYVELLLGIPGGTLASFKLYPGVPGSSRATVKDKAGRQVSGSKIVEAPKSSGYTLEAFIPWSAIPKSNTVRVGYRGGLFAHDADSSSRVESVVGSASSQSYGELPAISTRSELALGSGLLRERNIKKAPKFNLMANVVGDGLLERVLVYDRFVVVLGPGYRSGEQYYYRDLGTADVTKLELKDLTGDGKSDLVVEKRIASTLGQVSVLEVLSYHDEGETPQAAFSQEVAIALEQGGSIQNQIRWSGSGARTTIELTAGVANGLDAGDFQRVSSTGSSPVLLPWGTIASQRFEMKDGAFVLAKEESREGDPESPAPDPDPDTPQPTSAPRPAPTQPRTVTWQTKSAPDVERVYELYKQQRKVTGKPSFDVTADLANGGADERLVVHDRDIVVFGPDFRSGRGFTAITLAHFANGADIHSVTTRDVSGDGRHEIVVTGEMRSPLPEGAGSGEMHRKVVMIYKLKGEVLERVFAAEVARRVGDKRVEAKISFSAKGSHQITLKPGKAVGYDKDSYPWAQRTEPDGDFEPLLLPWGGITQVRLHYDQSRFVR